MALHMPITYDKYSGQPHGIMNRTSAVALVPDASCPCLQMRLLADWYHTVSEVLEISKLWLFDNSIGDAGAEACADLVTGALTELHLSHNQIGTPGAKAVLAGVPLHRPRNVKPLWLRMEWNQMDPEEIRKFVATVRQS